MDCVSFLFLFYSTFFSVIKMRYSKPWNFLSYTARQKDGGIVDYSSSNFSLFARSRDSATRTIENLEVDGTVAFMPNSMHPSFYLVSRFLCLVSFLVSRFSFLVSRFSFLVSRFSFLVLMVYCCSVWVRGRILRRCQHTLTQRRHHLHS